MTDVLQFPEAADPHKHGQAKCLQCGYEFVAVAPVGSWALDCPECGLAYAIFQGACGPPDGEEVWTCTVDGCGGQAFWILRDSTMCVKCGSWQAGFD